MKKLHLNLDMDGVFTDFREGLRRMCGIEYPKERLPADEFKKFQDFAGYKIWSRPFFWQDLNALPGALSFYENFRKYEPWMLTAIMRAYNLTTIEAITCGEEKRSWVRDHFGREQANRFNYTKADLKHTYCKAKEDPNGIYVLIDDHKTNIDQWEEAGGIGILHDTHESNDPAVHAAAQEKTLHAFHERVRSQLK